MDDEQQAVLENLYEFCEDEGIAPDEAELFMTHSINNEGNDFYKNYRNQKELNNAFLEFIQD